MQPTTVAAALASRINAMCNCAKGTGSKEWEEKHRQAIHNLVREFLPSGSGFDNGTQLDLLISMQGNSHALVFHTQFHHMEEGVYTCWTDHEVRVRPAFDGIEVTVTGRNTNDILSYVLDTFREALTQKIIPCEDGINYRSATWKSKPDEAPQT